MSIVTDQVRRVDSQLDRVHLLISPTGPATAAEHDADAEGDADAAGAVSLALASQAKLTTSPRILELQSIVKALSTTSSSASLLPPWRISLLLDQASLAGGLRTADVEEAEMGEEEEVDMETRYERELEWLLLSKATVQTYGNLLQTLLEQTIPVSDDIWYWDEVLGSYAYTSLYTVQTSPLRLWAWARDVYEDSKRRLRQASEGSGERAGTLSASGIGRGLTEQWRQFYGLVRQSIRERSVADLQRRVLSPVALCRREARHKQARLRRLREMGASGLGVLMDEGLSFGIDESSDQLLKADESDGGEWKVVVERSIALMDSVLRNITQLDHGISDFEETVFASVEDDPEISTRSADGAHAASQPARLSRRLQKILNTDIPGHVAESQQLASKYGRPSRLVRYWLPAGALLLSSTTILRIFVNRRAEILTWIRDLGETVRDFWMNWVVDPIRKIIGTIRHDKDSEVALMSRESLKGDRESLERMVVDFAIDNPGVSVGSSALTETQIAEIRAKVKEGDLTPVLRAYEKDLRKPFAGTVRGDLVRTLLIQVQKTKVDVEVALSGIDALLKSQELVFGFVGLTPGVLVCFATFRYLGSMFGSRRGIQQGRRARGSVRVLRNIDRILTQATPTQNNLLSYKDHGLLLCEVHELRKRARGLFPGEIQREFLEDVRDLCNIDSGIQAQLKVLDRIRWGYAKWVQY